MITVPWLLAARGVSLDRDSGYLSLFSVLSGVNAENFPLFFPQLVIVALMRREKSDPPEGKCVLTLFGRDEKIFDSEIVYDFKDKFNNQLMAQFQGLVVGASGDLRIELRLKKKLLASYIVNINGPAVALGKPPVQDAASSKTIAVQQKHIAKKRGKKSARSR